jgi:hypothetical protein
MKITHNGYLTAVTICALALLRNLCMGTDVPERLEPDVEALETAAGVYGTGFFKVQVDAPVAECEILVEGYRDGKVAFDSKAHTHGSIKSSTLSSVKFLRVCVCLRIEESPKYEWSEETRRSRRVPGTGSTRLGYSYTMVEEHGYYGSGGTAILPHAQFDFQEMRPHMTREDLPFTIVDRHHEVSAIPVLVYFPRKADIGALKGNVDALTLPSGTVVVYAAIKKKP